MKQNFLKYWNPKYWLGMVTWRRSERQTRLAILTKLAGNSSDYSNWFWQEDCYVVHSSKHLLRPNRLHSLDRNLKITGWQFKNDRLQFSMITNSNSYYNSNSTSISQEISISKRPQKRNKAANRETKIKEAAYIQTGFWGAFFQC